MKHLKWFSAVLVLAVAAGCGGGGSGGTANGAISGHVPYLLSSPTVTYSLSTLSTTTNYYDVTVTLQADGPTEVQNVDLWIMDSNDNSNFDHLDLANVSGTKKWTATTLALVPLPSGQYYLDSILLDDGGTTTLRQGWYTYMSLLSTNTYCADERETAGTNMLFYNFGVTGIHVTRFTLP